LCESLFSFGIIGGAKKGAVVTKVWLTYSTYKKRLSNGEINYATGAWSSEASALRAKEWIEKRDDIESVFVQSHILDAPLEIEDGKQAFAQHTQHAICAVDPDVVYCCFQVPKFLECSNDKFTDCPHKQHASA
jgi:hypothetical protein